MSNNLSEAARTMRTSDDPEERSEAAKKMGHAGGKSGHKDDRDYDNDNNNNKNYKKDRDYDNDNDRQGEEDMDLSTAAKLMRTSDDPEERHRAAQIMGHAGGIAKGEHYAERDQDQDQNKGGQGEEDMDLSTAAKLMRTSDDPEERHRAAQIMGHAGGVAKGEHYAERDNEDVRDKRSDNYDKGDDYDNKQSEDMDLSTAAKVMRTSDDPEERSHAASIMGHAGGLARGHNEDNDTQY